MKILTGRDFYDEATRGTSCDVFGYVAPAFDTLPDEMQAGWDRLAKIPGERILTSEDVEPLLFGRENLIARAGRVASALNARSTWGTMDPQRFGVMARPAMPDATIALNVARPGHGGAQPLTGREVHRVRGLGDAAGVPWEALPTESQLELEAEAARLNAGEPAERQELALEIVCASGSGRGKLQTMRDWLADVQPGDRVSISGPAAMALLGEDITRARARGVEVTIVTPREPAAAHGTDLHLVLADAIGVDADGPRTYHAIAAGSETTAPRWQPRGDGADFHLVRDAQAGSLTAPSQKLVDAFRAEPADAQRALSEAEQRAIDAGFENSPAMAERRFPMVAAPASAAGRATSCMDHRCFVHDGEACARGHLKKEDCESFQLVRDIHGAASAMRNTPE